jgi:hypothetical protein
MVPMTGSAPNEDGVDPIFARLVDGADDAPWQP